MDRVRAHVFISGRVQGVNFRVSTRNAAREAGVVGWVRNLSDGRVEAAFEGSNAAVRRLVSWCYSGPPAAEVERVELSWEDPINSEDSFSISY
jgi:acylphosphatase